MAIFGTFTNIKWRPTIIVNLTRSVMAGIAWMIIMFACLLFAPKMTSGGMPIFLPLVYPVAFPFIVFLLLLPASAIVNGLKAMGIPAIGMANIAFALFVIPADPLMAILHKLKPEFVPVDVYKFIEFSPIILVMKDSYESPGIESSSATILSPDTCPFQGRVISETGEGGVLGFKWAKDELAFTVNKNWIVSTPNDPKFGWIDKDGMIHKGIIFGDVNPHATLSGGITGIRILKSSGACYKENTQVGRFESV